LDSQSLLNALGILRLMKAGSKVGPSDTALALIRRLSGTSNFSTANLRVAAYLCDQVTSAKLVIDNSQLSEEAKEGVSLVLDGMIEAFSLQNLTSAYSNYVRNIPGAISNFVILISAAGLRERNELPEEVSDLITSIEATVSAIEDDKLDPIVRDISKRHLDILKALLKNVPILGLEPALTAYFELMSSVRRAEVDTSPEAKEKFEPIWKAMAKWGERLGSADRLWNAGAKLVEHADKAHGMLSYLPLS